MGQRYSFNQDEVWAAARKAADQEVEKARVKIAARCVELGIPANFAPDLGLSWYSCGENAVSTRCAQLRKMAQTRAEAIEREAIVQIERASLDAQTQLAVEGLLSDASRKFFGELPPIENLMPALSFAELSGDADPPIAQQLVSPNALRQRRFREKHKQLRATVMKGVTDERNGNANERNGNATDEAAE